MPNTTKFDFIETDRRILDQKLRRHLLTQPEYQKLLKTLVDDKESADELVVCKGESEEKS